MIDISAFKTVLDNYGGTERKFAISFNDRKYMVKEPNLVHKGKGTFTQYNTFSEYIGCRIFVVLDFPVQETFLAKYTGDDSTPEIVVVCKDFKADGEQLYMASNVAMGCRGYRHGRIPEYSLIQEVFNRVSKDLEEDAEERFWDTLVVDCLIGNKDRNLASWGFLSRDEQHLKLAPVYGCSSSLGADVDDDTAQKCLKDRALLENIEGKHRVGFCLDGQRMTYREILKKPTPKLPVSMEKLISKIDLNAIWNIIDETEGLSNRRKRYMFAGVRMRYENILLEALK